MVLRGLLAKAAALALVTAGCGDGTRSVAINIDLDENSCGVEATALSLTCATTLWVGVFDERGEPISHGCTSTSAELKVALLGEVLRDNIDLGSLPADQPVQISLAVVGDLGADCPEIVPEWSALLFGSTPLVVLDDAQAAIRLSLACTQLIPEGPPGSEGNSNPQACYEACDAELSFCLADKGLTSCVEADQICDQYCPLDMGCPFPCQGLAQSCLLGSRGPDFDCTEASNICYELCSDGIDECQSCSYTEDICVEINGAVRECRTVHDQCSAGCSASSCLSSQ